MKNLNYISYIINEDYSNDQLLEVNEAVETYIYDVSQNHDKIFKQILYDKEEARKFINQYLELEIPIEKEKIELYNSSYVTEAYKSKESDVVYKMKDKNIFFLIEHQSTIDLSMPYRIENYSMQIINAAIDKEKIKSKEYLYPRVIPIVLYTGNKKWKTKLSFSDMQEQLPGYKYQDRSYTIVDVNSYDKKELLESESLVSKIMLLEKSKTTKELIENIQEILEKEEEIEEYKVNKMIKIILLLLGKKVGEEEAKKILEKIIKRGEDDMLDVIERINAREKRELQKRENKGRKLGKEEGKKEGIKEGKKEGKIEGKVEVAKQLIKEGLDVNFINKVTGLKKEEIEKLYEI